MGAAPGAMSKEQKLFVAVASAVPDVQTVEFAAHGCELEQALGPEALGPVAGVQFKAAI